MSVVDVVEIGQVDKLLASGKLVVILFQATWNKASLQIASVLEELSKKHASVWFCECEAEDVPTVSDKYKITVVPTTLLLRGAAVVSRIEGAKVADIVAVIAKNAAETEGAPAAAGGAGEGKEELQKRLLRLVQAAPVMLFMKGTPAAPQCGFSRQAVEVLNGTGARFSSFNILEHADVRAGLKEMFNWPTFPQLYIRGSLVGGLDIMKELDGEGELKKMMPAEAFQPAPAASDSLEALVKRSRVMLAMKGTPDSPSCGFSNAMVQLLNSHRIVFDSINVLADPRVREGLKVLFDFPTFPQLYVDGKLLGGLDIAKEMAEDGSLLKAIPEECIKRQ